MKTLQIQSNQKGFTIVEVLVAMTLGLIILGSAIGMNISHQRGFQLTESKLNMQTNARFAYEFIASSLRESGSVGCKTAYRYTGDQDLGADGNASYVIAFNNDNLPYADFNPGREILGYENSEGSNIWTPTVPVAFSFPGNMLDGSDAITIRGAIGRVYSFTKDDMIAGDTGVQLDMTNLAFVALEPEHYAVMSMCNKAEVFKVTGTDAQVSAGTIYHGAGADGDDNEDSSFTIKFAGTSVVGELRRTAVTTYYIANNPAGVPTLYRDIDNVSDPLVEGVEKMQIEYGVNTDSAVRNVPNVFKTADWVNANGEWSNVLAIRIGFIMRSKDPVYETPMSVTHRIPGATAHYTYTTNDRFARVVYTATVNLRNRTLGERF